VDTITVDLTPSAAARLIRWQLSRGDDRFFEATADLDADLRDQASRTVLIQSVRPLPRAGLIGCSILISDVTGPTRVSFAAADDDPWAAVSQQDNLKDRLLLALGPHVLPESVAPETETRSGAMGPEAAGAEADGRDGTGTRDAAETRGPTKTGGAAQTGAAETAEAQAADVTGAWALRHGFRFEPTLELADLIASHVRDRDDQSDRPAADDRSAADSAEEAADPAWMGQLVALAADRPGGRPPL
jgi:hypothetical protein